MKKALLFDFDGTLFDSGPDFEAILNAMRVERGETPIDYAVLREVISEGSPKMIETIFQVSPGSEKHQALLDVFIQKYRIEMGRAGRLFAGVSDMLETIQAQDIPVGIVSNRKEDSLKKIVEIFQLPVSVLVGMDTVGKAKPEPEPLLHAAELLSMDPAECIFVGDHLIDIEAARRAKMESVLVSWGYRSPLLDLETWGAQHIIHQPEEIWTIYK